MNQSATNRPPFVFDGQGINGPDEYRSRLATLTHAGHRYGIGPLLADALNRDASTLKTQAAQIEELRGLLDAVNAQNDEKTVQIEGLRALLSNLPATPVKRESICVDGHMYENDESDMAGDGQFPSFYVFDPNRQANVAGPFDTRAAAQVVADRINASAVPAAPSGNDALRAAAQKARKALAASVVQDGATALEHDAYEALNAALSA